MTGLFIVMFVACLAMGLVASVIITPIFCLLRRIIYVPLASQKLARDAEKKGHVVTGRFAGYSDDGRNQPIYFYEYNGVEYWCYYNPISTPPDEIRLYFIKNPRKACLFYELGIHECNWFLYHRVIALIVAIILFAEFFVVWGFVIL